MLQNWPSTRQNFWLIDWLQEGFRDFYALYVSLIYGCGMFKRETYNFSNMPFNVFLQAAKYLPYGYGPSSGKNRPFIVEDVADSSDDEEEYGDYQVSMWFSITILPLLLGK